MCSTLTAVLFTFNLQTKSAPKICPGPQNVEMGHVTPTMPTQGIVTIRLALYVANTCTKFEVSSCNRCRDTSGGIKF